MSLPTAKDLRDAFKAINEETKARISAMPNRGMVLFIDDEKLPEWFGLPKDTPHANTFNEAYEMCCDNYYDIWYLDYDLDNGNRGDYLLILADMALTPPKKVFCISINQSGGVKKIKEVCDKYGIEFEDIGQRVMFEKFAIIDGQGG